MFSVPSTASPAIEASSFETMPSPETSVAFRPWSAELADDQAGFGVQAAPVDDGDAGFLHLGDQRREVLVADVDAFVHDFRDAGGVHRLLGLVGEALAVGGLVVDDGDLGVLELLGEIGAGDRALLVVAAAGAERVPQAALGEVRVGRGRRDLEDAVLGIDFRGRDRDARVEVADDELDAVSDELVGDRDALLRIGDVVADDELDLLAIDAAGRVDVGDGLLGALLELCAESGVRAGDRTGDADR